MTTERDIRNQIRYAEKKGMEKGTEKMAKNLKELGVDIGAIAKSSGLTEEQIKAL